jgi:carbonic anhydrase
MDARQGEPVTRPATPSEAWAALAAGYARFVAGQREHPNQDTRMRHELASGQRPFALFFGCADSRVAAEIIFDRGLGDLFVVRTAGHVVDSSVLGSMEFGIGVLGIPLIVVLGHDSCGAVGAAVDAFQTGDMPAGFVRDIVERITPSVLAASKHGEAGIDQIEAEHVRQTGRLLAERSHLIAERLASGSLGIVGATYRLREGLAQVVGTLGIDA